MDEGEDEDEELTEEKRKQVETTIRFLEWMSEKVWVPVKMFVDLLDYNDWMMLITWHAILESCVNQLLTNHFGNPKAASAFARLEMSNPKTGKMAFVSACELLPPKARTFIQKLSEMRNWAVHDIKHFDFSFERYRNERLDPKEHKAWHAQIGFGIPDFMLQEKTNINLRMGVFNGCINVITFAFIRDPEELPKQLEGMNLPTWKPPEYS